MTRIVEKSLGAVNDLILRMGGCCEAILHKAVRAVLERDAAAAGQVADDDLEIDRLDVELDEAVLRSIALQAPVADDLRRIIAAASIATNLERVGDLARNIAKSAERLAERSPIPLPATLGELAAESQAMLREALDTFVHRDAERAQRLLEQDDQVDSDQDRVVLEALEHIRAHPESSEQEVDLILVAKNLERVADHATNIAEEVIRIVSGRNVKHLEKLRRLPQTTATS